MSIFETIEGMPPDPIFGLYQEYLNDPRGEKINLGIGTFRKEDGSPYVLEAVVRAEKKIARYLGSKEYLPIEGDPVYIEEASRLLFKDPLLHMQTPGGTPALRVIGDLLFHVMGVRTMLVSEQTWPNHLNIFKRIGFEIVRYPYYDRETGRLKLEALIECVRQHPRSAVIWQPFCHNPTGMDIPQEVWDRLLALEQIPIFDVAYFGLKGGRDEEMYPIDLAIRKGIECFVATSFSKNFGLYAERIGLLSVYARGNRQALLSVLKSIIRSNYSNPPQHGSQLIREILSDAELKGVWQGELLWMRNHLAKMRKALGYTAQVGMFSLLNLSGGQIDRLREEWAIYLPLSGRINFAALTPGNIDRVKQGLSSVA